MIAIGRAARRDVRWSTRPAATPVLTAGDDAYLAGPYEELLQVLRREREREPGGGA